MTVQATTQKDWMAEAAKRRGRSPLQDAFRQLLKNRVAVISGIFIFILVFIALFVDNALFTFFTDGETKPLLAPYHYGTANFFYTDKPPLTRTEDGQFFLLGTDYLGRDLLSRVLYGTRISLTVAIVASFVSLGIGLVYGLISGYSSSRVDNLMMRIVDFLYGFPFLIFVILMQVFFKAQARRGDAAGIWQFFLDIDKAMGGMFFIFIAIGAINWLGMARIARGQTLAYKKKEFVEAARAIGATDRRIIFKHLLPNILGPCIVAETLAIPGYISLEAFLSFIGLGVNPPTPSWGLMISETYQALRTAPWEVMVPGIALTLTTLAFNMLGDGIRDAFDPRLRGE